MNIFLFLSIVFLLIFLVGTLLKKLHIPWIFAALIIGFMLALYNPFEEITSSFTFNFLADLGMYLLLFMIGFELDMKEMKSNSKFIVASSFIITIIGALFLIPLFYFLFHLDLILSIIIGLSFSTVGEAILIPILDEFKEVNTPLGQTIIGIGTLDDIIEISTLIFIIFLVGESSAGNFNVAIIIISLFILFILTAFFVKLKKKGKKFKFMNIETLFFFVIFTLFLFIGIGMYAEAGALGALLAGIGLKTFLPQERLKLIESEVKLICYGFFAPIFFLYVGLSMNIKYLILFPLLILLVVGLSFGSKLLGSYICGVKKLGTRDSLILGIGMSIRFSTSLVLVTILYKFQLITLEFFSIIIASSMI